MTEYYAHTSDSDDANTWQPLTTHLENVGELAAQYAAPFGGDSLARVAGCFHDIGKACREFQLRLRGKYPSFDHSIAGAVMAEQRYRNKHAGVNEGSLLATLIAGHHTGLQDYYGENSLSARTDSYKDGKIPAPATIEDLGVPCPLVNPAFQEALAAQGREYGPTQVEFLSVAMYLYSHLLFSALVDADWIDTERFMSPDEAKRRELATEAQATVAELLPRLCKRINAFKQDSPVNAARAALLKEVESMATLPPGLFELNMPTGSGKTLASMSFALRHAVANGQRRVIYAIPFMSIVEQTADVFRGIFGRENVLEHVSSYDYGLGARDDYSDAADEEYADSRELGLRERALSQNWDAPIIITTNVQLFESLFSNRTYRSRKTHNVANSVIILDEAQNLPDALLKPTLAMLETLAAVANVTVVLCTATQPALDSVWPLRSKPIKIIKRPERYDHIFGHRVVFDCSRACEGDAYSIEELADELSGLEQVLCVVSTRRAASAVFEALGERPGIEDGTFHLSALMVPEHRSAVIEEIKSRLSAGLPCRVVSTQLIEAGVDLDFPVVYREVAGTDSILQAAGRCNREGRLKEPGKVIVFDCKEFDAFRSTRPNWLGKMRLLGIEGIKRSAKLGEDPFGPKGVTEFFERRHQTGDLDHSGSGGILSLITDRESLKEHLILGHYPHATIAERYRFIQEEDISVFVPWGQDGSDLLSSIEAKEFSQEMFPRLQRFTISLHGYLYKDYEAHGAIRRISGFPVPILETRNGIECLYDDRKGLLAPREEGLDLLVI